MLTLRKNHCTLALLVTEKDTMGIVHYYIFIDSADNISPYYTCLKGTGNNNNQSYNYILNEIKLNYYLTSQRDTSFIEILADSIQTQHQGNFTIFGGSDLGFMTGTCPDCPDIFMTGNV